VFAHSSSMNKEHVNNFTLLHLPLIDDIRSVTSVTVLLCEGLTSGHALCADFVNPCRFNRDYLPLLYTQTTANHVPVKLALSRQDLVNRLTFVIYDQATTKPLKVVEEFAVLLQFDDACST
jgi:hypothetical protein